jgi:hypothetical protein
MSGTRFVRLTVLLVVVVGLVPSPVAANFTAGGTESDAHVVVAIIESGVNVYHREFARPKRTVHPSTYLEGYPSNARPLPVTLNAGSYDEAVARDDALWRGIVDGQLYYVPGTNLTGLVHLPGPDVDGSISVGGEENPRPVLDDYQFHGTGVASTLAGATLGACPNCDIVLVNSSDLEAAFTWAAQQPWIDVISNSWGGLLSAPTRATLGHPERGLDHDAEFSRVAAEAGKAVLFASGNGATGLGSTAPGPPQHNSTYESPFTGPPWVLTIGAAEPETGQPTNWHGIPVDVISYGERWPAAREESLDGVHEFRGTSNATPLAAGVIAAALLEARRSLGDEGVGPRGGSLIGTAGPLPASGPVADGELLYSELFDTARAVARWVPFDPEDLPDNPFITPTTDRAFAYEGFGLLDDESVRPLTEALLGATTVPQRPEMGSWPQEHEQRRTALWGEV